MVIAQGKSNPPPYQLKPQTGGVVRIPVLTSGPSPGNMSVGTWPFPFAGGFLGRAISSRVLEVLCKHMSRVSLNADPVLEISKPLLLNASVGNKVINVAIANIPSGCFSCWLKRIEQFGYSASLGSHCQARDWAITVQRGCDPRASGAQLVSSCNKDQATA